MSFEWTGRTDEAEGEGGRRWHQCVTEGAAGVSVVGFASDAGVARNRGRMGAADGPVALRKQLCTLPAWEGFTLRDEGDFETVEEYGQAMAGAIEAGSFAVGLGGGHDIAWGTFEAVKRARSGAIGVLSFDAHFDNRADEGLTSGTWMRLVSEDERFGEALVIGISETGNTVSLFERARESGVQAVLDRECAAGHGLDLAAWAARFEAVMVTVCLDVLPAAVAPGVSAPNGFGVPVDRTERDLEAVCGVGSVVALDVAELNPRFDQDERTARTAARLIYRAARTRR